MDDDFDILYMVKTPFFLGNMAQAKDECDKQASELQSDDHKNIQMKNLLMIRILTAQSNFPSMKEQMEKMMQDATQSKDV